MKGPRPRPPIERMLARIEMVTESGCWVWMGKLDDYGYAVIGTGTSGHYSYVRGHRLSYEHFRGPIPAGLTIDHLCRVRCCVNPHHLEAVTSTENTK